MEAGSKVTFCVSALGIFVFYFYFGLFQERITRGLYGEGDKQERFTHSMSVVFCMCVVNLCFSWLLQGVLHKQAADNTPKWYYAMLSVTYLVAMVTSNKALLWVNYPTQVIGKSCKPIPVMIIGVLFGRKSYPLLKYFFVMLIVIGVALFLYKDDIQKSGSSGETDGQSENQGMALLGLGEILLIVSLICDGLTGAIQERIKADYRCQPLSMMIGSNKWAVLYLGIALAATGELGLFIAFVQRHPEIVWQLASLSVASAFGQFFIFKCVAEFGPLPCSIVTTTRKFFTVLASVVVFGNQLSSRQWLGTILVFTGLLLDSSFGKSKSASVRKAT